MVFVVTPYGPGEQFEVEEADLKTAIDQACTVLHDRGTVALMVQQELYLPVSIMTGQTHPMFHIAEKR